MKNLANFILFQIGWFAAVEGAARESMWLGPLVIILLAGVHLLLIPGRAERMREVRYLLWVGLAGMVADSALKAVGAITYPTSTTWTLTVVPPWITSLWIAFATLPRFSLRWLAGRTWLAILFGAIGGPLSFYAGTRFGSVAVGESSLLTWGALAVEYAVATPVLLWLAPGNRPSHVREIASPCVAPS